ncbi:hypothetical protein L8106_02652 [Lyngbya sp. PCC 8106]|nr:hypothetical protein L8106_02652 [Lyngbya sp. PCC 8106]
MTEISPKDTGSNQQSLKLWPGGFWVIICKNQKIIIKFKNSKFKQ